jgi:hypothetical protein
MWTTKVGIVRPFRRTRWDAGTNTGGGARGMRESEAGGRDGTRPDVTSLLAWLQNIACAKRHVLDGLVSVTRHASHKDLTQMFPEQMQQTVWGTFTAGPKSGGARVACARIVGHPQTRSSTPHFQYEGTKRQVEIRLPRANDPTEAYEFSAQMRRS